MKTNDRLNRYTGGKKMGGKGGRGGKKGGNPKGQK